MALTPMAATIINYLDPEYDPVFESYPHRFFPIGQNYNIRLCDQAAIAVSVRMSEPLLSVYMFSTISCDDSRTLRKLGAQRDMAYNTEPLWAAHDLYGVWPDRAYIVTVEGLYMPYFIQKRDSVYETLTARLVQAKAPPKKGFTIHKWLHGYVR